MARHAITDCGSDGLHPVGTLRRWLMFNAVGGMGIGVQLLTLGALADGLGLDYRLGTALAVLAAVLHNFVWHEHWTWGDRCAGRRGRWARLGSFTLVNGTLSIAGNVLFTSLYVTAFDIHHVPANLMAIATCSVANFLASHHVVFRAAARPAALAAALAAGNVAGLGAAELKDKTVAAWERYVAATERRIAAELDDGERFLVLDFAGGAAEARRKVLAGGVVVERMEARDAEGRKIKVPSGAVHHWRGSILIPGITLDALLHGLMHAVAPEEIQKDVLESRLIAGDGDRREVFLKVRRESVVTVHYNTEHRVVYSRHGPGRASSRSASTRIAELEDAGSPAEREKPIGRDRGFLWRLNAYWRYQAVDGGVIAECESITLSRGIPPVLNWMIRPIINRTARGALSDTLTSMARVLPERAVIPAETLPASWPAPSRARSRRSRSPS